MAQDKVIVPGGIDEYIATFPKEVQVRLKEIRAAIESVSDGAIQTVSYFQIPGYSYPGYDYNGMFAWFSFKTPFVRLHVRPPVIKEHEKELAHYPTTASVVSFPIDQDIPSALVKKLVQASSKEMKK